MKHYVRSLLLSTVFLLKPAIALAGDFITCESFDDRLNRCPVRTSRDVRDADVRLVEKLSKSSCNEGRTWGVDRYGIWVDRGCRARFDIDFDRNRYNYNRGPGYNWDPYGRYNHRDQYDSGRRYDDYYRSPSEQQLQYERERIERERVRLEQERARLEAERRAAEAQARAYNSCPPGSRPGRCSDNDRRYGCRDWRTPSGLGCRSN